MTVERDSKSRWKKPATKSGRPAREIPPEFQDGVPGEEVLEAYPPHPGRRMTEEEFMGWVGERTRAEWVDGEVTIRSPVNFEHDQLQGWLYRLVSEFVEQHDLGTVCSTEFAVRLPNLPSFRLTDLVFVAHANTTGKFERARFFGVPDLIIEIVSPNSVERDYQQKFEDYQGAGVREYWILDPIRKRVELNELLKGKYRPVAEKNGELRSRLLKGFFIRPAWLWQKQMPRVRTALREMGIK